MQTTRQGTNGGITVVATRCSTAMPADRLTSYLRWLSERCDRVMVIDSSPDDAFDGAHVRWRCIVDHVRPPRAT